LHFLYLFSNDKAPRAEKSYVKTHCVEAGCLKTGCVKKDCVEAGCAETGFPEAGCVKTGFPEAGCVKTGSEFFAKPRKWNSRRRAQAQA